MKTDSRRFGYGSFLTLLILSAFVLAARLFYLYLGDAERFPITTVKITASYQHITHKQLESVLANYLNTSFFLLPVRQLSVDLMSLEWVKKVQVERIWPNILKINLVEKIPVATWNQEMMTEEGEVFNANDALNDSSLAHLYGPNNQQTEVLQVYQKMSKILSMYGLHAASLEWRDNQAWELTLSNGVRLRLGKQELETRITRFCKAYPAVFAERGEQLVSVDLRYPRGMAVQWKN